MDGIQGRHLWEDFQKEKMGHCRDKINNNTWDAVRVNSIKMIGILKLY